jgi:3',5'-cyclic AMP phosphodiesterase CpdA
MPVLLHPPTRRRFLASVAASAGVLVVRPAAGRAADVDPHRVALLSDAHVPEKPETADRGFNMTDRLRQVVAEVAKLGPRPACAVFDGDLAHKAGTAGEYAAFGKLVEPVRAADVPLYLTLGNHDRFDRFAAALAAFRPKDRPVDGKQVLVIELERANLFVLDSFDPKNTVGGKLGADQLKWLASALDARTGKPAVVFAHHPLQFAADKAGKFTGLADAAELWPVLKERPQVKAYVFGHTHTWRLAEGDGIHLINLPAIGYPFAKGEVTGWVDAHLTATGVKLELRALDAAHPKHGDTAELTWRKG